jgi:hypothetical protein
MMHIYIHRCNNPLFFGSPIGHVMFHFYRCRSLLRIWWCCLMCLLRNYSTIHNHYFNWGTSSSYISVRTSMVSDRSDRSEQHRPMWQSLQNRHYGPAQVRSGQERCSVYGVQVTRTSCKCWAVVMFAVWYWEVIWLACWDVCIRQTGVSRLLLSGMLSSVV